MSFHRSKLEMNRRLDFRTGGGYLLIKKLICLLWVVAACCKGGLPIYSCILSLSESGRRLTPFFKRIALFTH
jgi:hypothetical protein